MDTATIIVLIGIFLTNCSIILAAWIKMKTDIASINVQIKAIEFRIIDVETEHKTENDKLHMKVEKFSDLNNQQHETIAGKIDEIKTSLHEFELKVVSQLK